MYYCNHFSKKRESDSQLQKNQLSAVFEMIQVIRKTAPAEMPPSLTIVLNPPTSSIADSLWFLTITREKAEIMSPYRAMPKIPFRPNSAHSGPRKIEATQRYAVTLSKMTSSSDSLISVRQS